MDGVNSDGKGRRMCVAGGCSRRKSDGVSLHQFPFDRPAFLLQWTAVVHNYRKNWNSPTKASVLSSFVLRISRRILNQPIIA